MAEVCCIDTLIERRDDWAHDPNPHYEMDQADLFDVGSGHQTALLRMKPGAMQHLHFHRAGCDIFFILRGEGELTTARLTSDGGAAIDLQVRRVRAGDLYSIQPLEIHRLVNVGREDLVWLNVAPTSHGGEDLVEVEGPGTCP